MGMIERVQEALTPLILAGPRAKQDSYAWTQDIARAAIEAMREPDEAVVAAGVAAGGKAYEYTSDTDVCHPAPAWKAMIDAALSEIEPQGVRS